jgi:uncharacterized Fe-S cluster-containing radical SAM superfamily protein
MKARLKPAINHDNWLDNTEKVVIRVTVRPYNLKELCQMYNLTYRVFKLSIEPFEALLGEKKGYFYTAKQVEIIFLHLGIPYNIHEV